MDRALQHRIVPTDGAQVVTGMGSRVLVYDANDGDLLHALKGHKVLRATTDKPHRSRRLNATFAFRTPYTVSRMPKTASDSRRAALIRR